MDDLPEIETVDEFVELVGRQALADAVPVGIKAVGMAANADRFPSSWFEVVNAFAALKSVSVPNKLFNFKRANLPLHVSSIEQTRGEALPQERGPLPRIEQNGCAG